MTEHEPDERVHDAAENVPLPEEDQLTAPVGEKPVTVAEQVVLEPSTTEDGEQETDVVVVALLIVIAEAAELPALLESPP